MDRPDWLAARVEALAGRRVVSWRHVVGGGFTPSERWVVAFDDGRTAFVKGGTDVNPEVAGWLRVEHNVYSHVEAPFLPRLLGWDDGGGNRVVLLLEDLSWADWQAPWTPERIERVLATLDAIHASTPSPGLPTLESDRDSFQGWSRVAEDPSGVVRLGLCSEAWLRRALPVLVEAEAEAVFAGSDLLHLDVRSDNICFAGERTVFVDWNWACPGNGRLDVVSWLPSLALEGGPAPEEIIDDEPELGAVISGFFAQRAPMPEIHTAPRVRTIQKAQLRVALPWAARMLGLPPPE